MNDFQKDCINNNFSALVGSMECDSIFLAVLKEEKTLARAELEEVVKS